MDGPRRAPFGTGSYMNCEAASYHSQIKFGYNTFTSLSSFTVNIQLYNFYKWFWKYYSDKMWEDGQTGKQGNLLNKLVPAPHPLSHTFKKKKRGWDSEALLKF